MINLFLVVACSRLCFSFHYHVVSFDSDLVRRRLFRRRRQRRLHVHDGIVRIRSVGQWRNGRVFCHRQQTRLRQLQRLDPPHHLLPRRARRESARRRRQEHQNRPTPTRRAHPAGRLRQAPHAGAGSRHGGRPPVAPRVFLGLRRLRRPRTRHSGGRVLSATGRIAGACAHAGCQPHCHFGGAALQ